MNPHSALEIDRLARKRAAAQLGWFTHAAVYLAVNLGLALLALGTAHRHWPVFPALGWGLGLLAHGVAVWGAGHGNALRMRRAPVAGDADPAVAPLQWLLAAVRMVPVADILVFEAADKYLRMLTTAGEYLIRTSLRELQPQLPSDDFWQVHRGTLVRVTAIDTVERDDAGRLRLTVRGLRERFGVSRLYAARFRAM